MNLKVFHWERLFRRFWAFQVLGWWTKTWKSVGGYSYHHCSNSRWEKTLISQKKNFLSGLSNSCASSCGPQECCCGTCCTSSGNSKKKKVYLQSSPFRFHQRIFSKRLLYSSWVVWAWSLWSPAPSSFLTTWHTLMQGLSALIRFQRADVMG